jgi:hypothetical protein
VIKQRLSPAEKRQRTKRRKAWRRAKAGLRVALYSESEPVPVVIVKEDGREICSDTPEGRAEYWERTKQMANRQGWICACGCGERLDFTESPFREGNLSFDHEHGRGRNRRDDRILLADGSWQNAAMKYLCNQIKGSRRIQYAEHARFTREAAGSVGESE